MASGQTIPPKETDSALTAQGHLEPSPDALNELGSSQPAQIPDVVPTLGTFFAAVRKYEEMVNGDVSVDVALRAAKVPVQAATFYMEAFSDSQEDKDITAFVEYNLFKSAEVPFIQVLQDILRMFEHGYAPFELVWENRQWAPPRTMANRKLYTMLKKIAYRPATTITAIDYDNFGGLVSITQQALGTEGKVRTVSIPLRKLAVFTFNGKGGRIEGKSLLRTAYKNWYYKEHLYKVDAIQKERHGIGVPDILLPLGATQADKDFAHELGRNLRTNEKAYIVRQPGMEVGFAKPEGQLVNVMSSIDHHNGQIMLNVLAQFLLLGMEGTSGGRSTSGAHVDMFQKSLKYVADYICGIFNLYIIPRMVAYNFDTDHYPSLGVKNIGEAKDLQALAAAFSNLVHERIVTMDLETEQFVRDLFGMPLKVGDRPELPEPTAGGVLGVDNKTITTPTGQATSTNGKKNSVTVAGPKAGGGNTGKLPGEA